MFLFCLVFAMFCARLFICALWSPAGKGLTSWLSFVVSTVSQVWYLIVSIPDLCTLTYFAKKKKQHSAKWSCLDKKMVILLRNCISLFVDFIVRLRGIIFGISKDHCEDFLPYVSRGKTWWRL